MSQEGIQKLGELIDGIKIVMLTTQDPDGALRSRPMVMQERDFDGDLWFFTGKSTGKVSSIRHDDHVNLAFASPEDSRFVSVTGRATIVDDPAKAKELWKPLYKAWFPEGLQDPELMLLKISVESAEYWDSHKARMVGLVDFAKALVTGEQYQATEEENGRIDLRH
ncbi:MAG: pyridoxamine 5'-phosphate oxidase family protein [Bdellovibrionaceae bacterium]|nr:pyridoxamine 5'-phosphate oxidase family protein [Pseudobdellovibrionaceae bacterium]MBX3034605.1 pyridoxamine 5'-phosphate oxidase family protein [Pseudobdellovibrionaceae bacterium]